MKLNELRAHAIMVVNEYHDEKVFSLQKEKLYLNKLEPLHTKIAKDAGRDNAITVLTEDDLKSLSMLPDTMPIYRGYREDSKRLGVSWSLSRIVAETFAYDAALIASPPGEEAGKYQQIGQTNSASVLGSGVPFYARTYTDKEKAALKPKVVTGFCRKRDVLAYIHQSRLEQEIIINPNKVKEVVNILFRGEPQIARPNEDLKLLLTTEQHTASEILK